MKRTIFPAVLIAALSLTLGACTPESLEGLDDPSNVSTNNSTSANTGTGNNGGGTTFTPEFLAVHAIMTDSCALAGCHGPNSAGGSFLVPTGQNAQPGELQASLTDQIAASGDLLVDPGNSGGSDLYNRLIAQPPLLMPTTGSLPQGEIDTVRDWIDNGAAYTQ
jgi:hypothetical protein